MTYALLDERRVIAGYVHQGPPSPYRIEVPDDCDLIPGRYFWHPATKAFWPTPEFDYLNLSPPME